MQSIAGSDFWRVQGLSDGIRAIAMSDFKTYEQASAYHSPWTLGQRIRLLAWGCCWTLFCSWTPKPLNRWRLLWLKLFGCQIEGIPFVHQRARIQNPAHLSLKDRACLGDRANAYSLGNIEIGARSTIAQEAYLCAGTHDFSSAELPLITQPIIIGEDVFIGARAFILPGVQVGAGAIVGACAVVTRSVDPGMVVAGNPAKVIRARNL